MLYPSVGVIITPSGVLLIWKPRSCFPWQIINFKTQNIGQIGTKKAEYDVHHSKFRFFSGATLDWKGSCLWPIRSFSGKPPCVTGRRGLMGKCAWFRWWWWWTWWEKGWRGALLGAPVGDGNPCSSGRWLPWTWWKPSGQSFTCALRCSQEKGADFLEIQDCHQLLRNFPFSVEKFLEVFYHGHFTLAAGGLANTRSTYWRSLTERSNWNWSVGTCWAFSPVLCWNEVK